ncbi:hypothetical protein CTAM01_01585, partial [Colletotrichum tamarilloi]
ELCDASSNTGSQWESWGRASQTAAGRNAGRKRVMAQGSLAMDCPESKTRPSPFSQENLGEKRSTCTRQMDPSKSPQDSSGHRMAHREVTELTEVDGASGAWWSPPTTPAHHPPSLGKVAASATRTSSCGAVLAAPRPCALSCQSVTALAALGPG